MITYLTEDWDDAIRNCFYHCGPGRMSCDSYFGAPLKMAVLYLVNDCCDIIGRNKNVNIKAEFKSDFVDIAELAVYVIFSVFDPIEKVKRIYQANKQGQVLVKIKLPSFCRRFNENPDEFYQEAIQILWNGYKDYMKGKFNCI